MYVIWDWNGTLLDDTSAALNALNVILTRRNLRPLSLAEYRETFAFPTVKFYESLGIELNDDISREFHEAYYSFPAKLNAEACAAVNYLAEKGIGQSILSALRQDHLEKDVRRYFGDRPQNGDCPHFDHIVGSDNLDGGTKFERGEYLLKLLTKGQTPKGGLSPEDIVMIGDAIHDKEVADALGVKCLLVSVGGHSHHRLAAHAPTFPSLLSAVHSL